MRVRMRTLMIRSTRARSEMPFNPFNRRGKLRLVFYTDLWVRRFYARLRGWPLWHRVGYIED